MTHQDELMLKKLRETMGKMELALSTIVDGIAWTDSAGRIQWCNEPFNRLVGLPRISVIGASIQDLLPLTLEGNPLSADQNPLHLALKSASKLTGTYEFKKLDSSYSLEVTSSRFELKEDGISTVFVVHDITDLKKVEEQFRQSQKMEVIGRLAGGVAHDFNNLLTVIKGYSDLLHEELKELPSARDKIEEIRKSSQQAATITAQLLAFGRQEVASPKVLDANAALTESEGMLKPLIPANIKFRLIPSKESSLIKADPLQIQQIILNLVVNARDAMLDGGTLTLETHNVYFDQSFPNNYAKSRIGHYVMIAVTDTGIGMSAETQARIFEPFFTTKNKGKGAGLGLSTVYGIVKKTGGNIWVYSEPGRGSTFKVYLPRAFENGESAVTPPSLNKKGKASGTILLVEDEVAVRQLILNKLSTEGYKIYDAGNGLEALELTKDGLKSVDLVVTDIVMPHMGGVELVAELKKKWPDVNVLFISGYTENTAVKEKAWDQKINFLQKPFALHELCSRVENLISC